MIRKAPSPVPFEGGLECRPEDRAAPALVIEPAGRRFAPPCPSSPRELIVAAMPELALHYALRHFTPFLVPSLKALAMRATMLEHDYLLRTLPHHPTVSLRELSCFDGAVKPNLACRGRQ